MTAQTDLFDSMLEDIYVFTKRPDLDLDTQLALRTATLAAHSYAAFPRDLNTSLVKLPNAVYQASIDAQVLLPRLRGLNTARIVDVDFNPLEYPRIEVVQFDDIYDPEYQTLKNDIAYLAGTAVNFRHSVASYGYLVSYFQVPQVRRDVYNSWIAQLAPTCILLEAASIVLTNSGNMEKSKEYRTQIERIYKPQLIADYSQSVVR